MANASNKKNLDTRIEPHPITTEDYQKNVTSLTIITCLHKNIKNIYI